MKINLIILLMILIFLISCSPRKNYTVTEENGIKYISNSEIPNNPKLKVKLKKQNQFQGFNDENDTEGRFCEVTDLKFDNSGNMFITDNSTGTISKFTSEGGFLKSFGGKGEGPGEFDILNTFFIRNDTIYIPDFHSVASYDLQGELIEKKKLTSNYFYTNLINVGEDTVVTATGSVDRRGDDRYRDAYFLMNLQVLNADFTLSDKFITGKEICVMDVIETHTDSGYFFNYQFTSDGKLIYVASRLRDAYHIELFELNGNKVSEISKKEEIESYSEDEWEYAKVNQLDGYDNDKFFNIIYDNKVKTNALHYDQKAGYLWVERVMNLEDSSVTFDIFQDGIYQNSFAFQLEEDNFDPLRNESRFYLNKGRLYFYDEDDNCLNSYVMEYIK